MSGIRFQCPSCGKQRSVNERMVGRSIRCPQCDAQIMIPAPEDIVAPVSVMPIEDLAEDAEVIEDNFDTGYESELSGFRVDQSAEIASAISSSDGYNAEQAQESDGEEIEDVSLGERPPMDEEMDMTPMVDVTFLLLIFFMVTASFASEKVIQQRTPKKDASSSATVEVVDILTIRIDDLNTFLVMMPDQTEVDASNKQDLLIALGNARREGLLDDVENVKVEAHESSTHSALVAALDSCRTEGMSNFQVKVVEDFD